jgi:hypothetical protein
LAHCTSPGWWWMKSVEQCVECLAGETELLGENLHPVLHCPPQIPRDLTQAWTQAATVGSRWLTAWAMTWPTLGSYTDVESFTILLNLSFGIKLSSLILCFMIYADEEMSLVSWRILKYPTDVCVRVSKNKAQLLQLNSYTSVLRTEWNVYYNIFLCKLFVFYKGQNSIEKMVTITLPYLSHHHGIFL